MSLIINIYYTGKADNALRFANEMRDSGIVNKIRAEEGNIRYEYFTPIDEANTVLLIDEWQSQEALDMHHASPMMSEIAKLREKYDLHMRVECFMKDDDANAHNKEFIRE